MSQCFSFDLYFPIGEFERAIRELEKVTDCGSNREGSVILPDRREFRSRLFNREQLCFSEKNKTYDFLVTPVVTILAEETELSEFDEVVGPESHQQALIRMSAHLAFGRNFLRIGFHSGIKSLSFLLMYSISTDKFFLDLYQNGRGLFALWSSDYRDGIYPLVPAKVYQSHYRYDYDSEVPSYKAYEPDFRLAVERSRFEQGWDNIDYETETLLDEIQLLDVDQIRAIGLGIPEGYFLQKKLKRIAREKPQADQAFIDEVLLTQSCYDGNLPAVEELLSQGVSCRVAIDRNLLHLKKWFFADADFVNELTPLMAAATNGRIRVMERLLEHGTEVNQPNREGYTALELAAGHEHDDGLALLLAGGAKIPTPKNHKGALELAAEKGVPDSVRRILDAPNSNLTETDKLRALIYAIRNSDISDEYPLENHQEAIEHLLSQGLNLNCPVEARTSLLTIEDDPYEDESETEEERRQTDTFLPLLEGVLFCRPETVEMMIRAGADVQQVFQGHSPFDRAVYSGDVEMMDLLLQQGATFTPSRISELLAEIAPDALERSRFQKTASRLITLGAEWTTQSALNAALSVAVENGDPDQVSRLLKQDADPNLVVGYPHYYCYDSHNLSLLSLAINQGHTTVAERLLKHPAIRLQDVDHSGKTALHHAMEKGAVNLIKRMVKQIQINLPYGEENHRKPALILSIENGLSEIAEQLLMSPEIDVNAVDPYGKTALHLAARKLNIETMRQLLRKGARPDPEILHDPDFLSSGAGVDQILSLLVSSGLNIDQRDDQSTTPLMNAALYAGGHNSYAFGFDALLNAGADPNLIDSKNRTAATYCLMDDSLFDGDHDFKNRQRSLDRLVASGADLSIGYNPLMFLASYNRPDLMECLLPYQINPDACLPDGSTALHIAAARGFYESVVLLLKAGATIDRRNKAGQTPLYLALSCFLGKDAADIVPIYDDLERHGMAPQKMKTTLFLASEQKERTGTSRGKERIWYERMFKKVLTSFKNRH